MQRILVNEDNHNMAFPLAVLKNSPVNMWSWVAWGKFFAVSKFV